MPPKSHLNKGPCSLCHQVVQELKYHYDICEPCHRVVEIVHTDGLEEDSSDEESLHGDDAMDGCQPDSDVGSQESTKDVVDLSDLAEAEAARSKRAPLLKRS